MAKLTAAACAKLADGRHTDGDGLVLVVRGDARSWVFRYSINGRKREIGLGKLANLGLAEARRHAGDLRTRVRQGVDPLGEKEAARAESSRQLPAIALGPKKRTLLAVVRAYHERFAEPVLTTKHAKQWINSIEQHVPAAILNMPINAVRAGDLLDALQPLYSSIVSACAKVRQGTGELWCKSAPPPVY